MTMTYEQLETKLNAIENSYDKSTKRQARIDIMAAFKDIERTAGEVPHLVNSITKVIGEKVVAETRVRELEAELAMRPPVSLIPQATQFVKPWGGVVPPGTFPNYPPGVRSAVLWNNEDPAQRVDGQVDTVQDIRDHVEPLDYDEYTEPQWAN